ncbi:MFS general substrate transporter [Gonapodya prolifera JEL478]|uniref:MFS general substrate transporter n=1 Tax=Gonapodya prolifera (strain JEL478) TaxID=1344416 RepID=A0A139AX64_GONPJ|nr:MFS general substrate transporter [Gonapodya prolifera JEL478]|eukprot:KXS21310.1 MFS general substrate transporter [Gonapodya prolifera JEL478]
MEPKDAADESDIPQTQGWTEEEERAVIRKLDWRIVSWLGLCYFALNLDRNNLSNATIMNAETPERTLAGELGLVGSQFNWAVSVFYFGYILCEVPSNLMITKVSPSTWIARIMTTWGIAATCLGAVQNFAGLAAVRVIIGAMEGGFAPGTAFYMAFWYKKYELTARWALMYAISAALASFSGLLAYGVANMNGLGNLSGWRWLFILEGLVSVILGIATIWCLPDYPQTCSFLTTREKEIIVGRLPPTGPSVVAKKFEVKEVVESLKDWRLYSLSLSLMLMLTPAYAIATFQPTVIKLMGFVSTQAQLLSIAPALLQAIFVTIINYSSDRYQEKLYHGVGALVCPTLGYFLLATVQPQLSPYGRYGLLFLNCTCNSFVAMCTGFSTITTKGSSRAAFRSAFVLTIGNVGGVIGPQIYQPGDAPYYAHGHLINGALLIAAGICYGAAVVSIIQEGEFVGKKANMTVAERGGLEIEGEKLIDVSKVINTSSV